MNQMSNNGNNSVNQCSKESNAKYEAINPELKVILVGNSGVGKSSLLLKFTDDTFDDNMQNTIGVDYRVKYFHDNKPHNTNITKVKIWDTAGQEKYRKLIHTYFKGCNGIIFVYDVSNKESFEELNFWLNETKKYIQTEDNNFIKLLIANKIDLLNKVISTKEGEEFARNNGMIFAETSAKTNSGVSEAFNEIVIKV